jgi:hypothetical protein
MDRCKRRSQAMVTFRATVARRPAGRAEKPKSVASSRRCSTALALPTEAYLCEGSASIGIRRVGSGDPDPVIGERGVGPGY